MGWDRSILPDPGYTVQYIWQANPILFGTIMELRHLRYFLAVAAEGNVTRAAEKLGIGQPPLSQQIKHLEHEMGVTLFRRTAHGVVLTSAGKIFEAEAARVLEDAHRAVRAAQRAERGEVGHMRLGFTGSAAFNPIVPAAIQQFKNIYPETGLTLEEANTPKLMQALVEGRLDLAFFRLGLEKPDGLRLWRLPDEPMKIVLPSAHALAAKRSLPLAALADAPFVLVPGPEGATLYSEIVDACRAAGFQPILAQSAPQVSSVINLVAAGLGVSIVPASLSQVQVKGVRYLDIRPPTPVARLVLACRADNASPVVNNFVALLSDLDAR
jgi:DNA-binding transcriptional LysR family regulator